MSQEILPPEDEKEQTESPNPFDPARFRLTQDFASSIGVKQKLITVPVRKPSKEWWVQTHPDPEYRLETAVLELKEDRETYLIEPDLWPDLATESTVSPRVLFTSVNRQGVLFLWPVRMPGADGRIDEWSRSAIEATQLAQGKWVRVASNMSLGAYEVFEANASLADPKWPDISLGDILKIAFRDKFIKTLDHPVLKRLRGEK